MATADTATSDQAAQVNGAGGRPGPPKRLDSAKLRKFHIGSIDQGTTSTRFLIFDGNGMPVASHQIEFEQKYPESG